MSNNHRNDTPGDGQASDIQVPHIARTVPLHEKLARDLKNPKPVTRDNPPEPIRTGTGYTPRRTTKNPQGSIEETYEGFSTLEKSIFWIVGIVAIGFGLQITVTTRVVENDGLNFLLGAGTIFSMLYGVVFAAKLFKGLRAGAFVGFAKILAVTSLLVVVWEEMTAISAKFDPALTMTYIRVIAPACLGYYFVVTMWLILLKHDEKRNRKLTAIQERTEHNQKLRAIRGPERKAKAEAKADAMGSFAALVARWKVVVLAFVFSLIRGWIITIRQAWALAGEKHEETGRNIASYEPVTRTKKATKKKSGLLGWFSGKQKK
ncbi:MAG TPA: hypothetical protein VKP65_13430 [Rhodothermales bacterium]|nr:hypothetical protein [Rhodothermales bacterium]